MRKLITRVSLAVAFAASSIALLPAQTAKRPMSLDDLAKIKNVSDPQCSPDGKSVAFTVSMTDMKEDKSNTHIWSIDYDGKNERQLTSSQDSESAPRFSA